MVEKSRGGWNAVLLTRYPGNATIEHSNADGKYSLGMGDMDHALRTYLRSTYYLVCPYYITSHLQFYNIFFPILHPFRAIETLTY